ncbi:MAG: hypothetical protein JSR66_10920 [Proteobacteria bacterium]|nr:hypothetical protein [Pseudomonadota bacterium]
MAMRVGRHYKLQTIQPRHWGDAAKSLKIPTGALVQRIRDMTAFPDAIADTARAVERQNLRHPNLTRLRDQLHLRVAGIKVPDPGGNPA